MATENQNLQSAINTNLTHENYLEKPHQTQHVSPTDIHQPPHSAPHNAHQSQLDAQYRLAAQYHPPHVHQPNTQPHVGVPQHHSDAYHQNVHQNDVNLPPLPPRQNNFPNTNIPNINQNVHPNTQYQDPLPNTNVPTIHPTIYTVRNDHNLVKANIATLLTMDVSTHDRRDAKQRLLNDTIAMLAQHDVAEEVVVYRAVKKVDKQLARLATLQTKEMEILLYEIDRDFGNDVDKPNFTEKFKVFENLLLHHIQYEEANILPALERQLTAGQVENINTWFERVKKIAPTRPHPDGPHSAAGNIATGPALAFVDMMRDMKKKFTK